METFYFDLDAADPKLVFNLLATVSPPGGTIRWTIADTGVIDFLAGDPGDVPLPNFRIMGEGQTTIRATYSLEGAGSVHQEIIVRAIGVRIFPDVPFAAPSVPLPLPAPEDPASFIRQGPLRMSRCFYDALVCLGKCIVVEGAKPRWRRLYGQVVRNIQSYLAGGTADLKYLKTFIYYNVFKKGDHVRSKDELEWGMKLAKAITGNKDAGDLGNVELDRQFLDIYMCETVYTERVTAFLRRDLPSFVYDVLRAANTGATDHIFEMSNGVSIAYAAPATLEDVTRKYRAKLPASDAAVEFVPFDPCKFMIATVEVPVMGGSPRIQLPSAAPRAAGLGPGDMGYRIPARPERAGFCRRSLNSQRVIDLADFDDDDNLILLQFKGSGVPEYGFGISEEWTGGEFFKLNAERGCMGLRDFSTDVFGVPSIAPRMAGMALVTTRERGYASSTRTGAVSFRLDSSAGFRVPDVNFAEGHTALLQRARTLFPGVTLSSSEAFNGFLFAAIMRNFVIANLFGMYYDDSTLKDLGDIGLQGEFSDSGTLRNLVERVQVSRTTLFSFGVRARLGPSVLNRLDAPYVRIMIAGLRTIAHKGGRGAGGIIGHCAERLEVLRLIDLSQCAGALEQFCAEVIGGKSVKNATACQVAFYDRGIQLYASMISGELEQFCHTLSVALCEASTDALVNLSRRVPPIAGSADAVAQLGRMCAARDWDGLSIIYARFYTRAGTSSGQFTREVDSNAVKNDEAAIDRAVAITLDTPRYSGLAAEDMEKERVRLKSQQMLLRAEAVRKAHAYFNFLSAAMSRSSSTASSEGSGELLLGPSPGGSLGTPESARHPATDAPPGPESGARPQEPVRDGAAGNTVAAVAANAHRIRRVSCLAQVANTCGQRAAYNARMFNQHPAVVDDSAASNAMMDIDALHGIGLMATNIREAQVGPLLGGLGIPVISQMGHFTDSIELPALQDAELAPLHAFRTGVGAARVQVVLNTAANNPLYAIDLAAAVDANHHWIAVEVIRAGDGTMSARYADSVADFQASDELLVQELMTQLGRR